MRTNSVGRRYIRVTAVIIFCGSLVLIYCERYDFGVLHPVTNGLQSEDEIHQHKDTKIPRQKVLVIMTQTRSGSTFTGEIFAATKNSMYLYEPLYPYGLGCGLPEERVALLKQLLSCDFVGLRETYLGGFKKSNWKKDGAHCLRDGLCFADQTRGDPKSQRQICQDAPKVYGKSINCGFPLTSDHLQKTCKASNLLVTKVNRMCTLKEMDGVYRHLKAGNRDVYVLHMLRDVRGILSSSIKLNPKTKLKSLVGGTIQGRCPRQRNNVLLKAEAYRDYLMMTDGRYMRIRYEDFAANAAGTAAKVFKFMGRSLPPEVVHNIKTYLHPNANVLQKLAEHKNIGEKILQSIYKTELGKMSRQYENLFGVVRDPIKILNEWRHLVPFEHVQEIQSQCGDVLKEMGYTIFSSEEELKDLSRPSFQIQLR